MKLKQILPVASTIAAVAAVYILIAQYFHVSALWLPYISWTLYSAIGGKPSNLVKEVLGLTVGMIFGYLTLISISPLSGYIGITLTLPVLVFLVTFFIILLETVELFNMIPAYFFSYTSYFAYYFGAFGGIGATPLSIIPLFWVLLMIGVGLGFISSELRRML